MASLAHAPRTVSRDRLFFTGMTLALAAIVAVGFAPSFYLRWLHPAPVPTYLDAPRAPMAWMFAVHGALFSAWLVVLVAQAWLVGARRIDLHKKVGLASIWLYAAMLAAGAFVAIYAARFGFHVPGFDRVSFFAVPVIALGLFAVLGGMGLNERKDVQRHKRLMLLATIAMTGAATARTPFWRLLFPPQFEPSLLLILVMLGYDMVQRGRPHPTTVKAGLCVALLTLGAVPIGLSPPWHALMGPLLG